MIQSSYMNLTLLLAVVLLIGIINSQSFSRDSRPETGKTHNFKAEHYYNTFSFAHPPALRIKPGDRVVTRTVDAIGYDENNIQVAKDGNPQVGPFYVEGAESGDILIVRLEKIEPNRTMAWSGEVLAPYAADPDFLRAEALRESKRETWEIDMAKGVARPTSGNIKPSGIEVPLKPMLGCVAVAPPGKEAVATSTPGVFGGNMDYFGMNEGVILMLPVFESGALLFIGDGHACQGHGEVVGSALEVSMNVEFSVDLIKNKKIGWPRIENDDYIMALGSARPLIQALQHATTELLRWMMNDFGFDERGASLLMGHTLEYDIANIVDPHFTVVAKIRKKFLKGK